jgi:hypothetical protein
MPEVPPVAMAALSLNFTFQPFPVSLLGDIEVIA